MLLKDNLAIDDYYINKDLKRLINQIYKLLPSREEGTDWQKPLENIIEEISGMKAWFIEQQDTLFILLCKLKGLIYLTEEEDFGLYRRTIFECLGLLHELEV